MKCAIDVFDARTSVIESVFPMSKPGDIVIGSSNANNEGEFSGFWLPCNRGGLVNKEDEYWVMRDLTSKKIVFNCLGDIDLNATITRVIAAIHTGNTTTIGSFGSFHNRNYTVLYGPDFLLVRPGHLPLEISHDGRKAFIACNGEGACVEIPSSTLASLLNY